MPFPSHLGKYEIRRELGKGSMGVVYEAFDPLIERSVAIKIIRPDQLGPSQSVELLARLKREAQAVGRLNHPGVVAIYDYGEDASFGGTKVAFIAMELIDGKELKHYFDNKHRFSPGDIARIMGEVLTALQHAHERGVTHRDVKPSNVILLRSGAVKIADFGVARLEKSELTQAGTMIGTPMYMSPEQILGMAGVDGRADIFSCGVMLYQFLTGEKPFTGSVTIVMQKVLNEEPPPPSQLNPALSPAWDPVVRKAMAKKPADRYQSAAALADAIRGAAATKGGDESTVVLPIQRPSAGATLNVPAAGLGNGAAPVPPAQPGAYPPAHAPATPPATPSGAPTYTAPPASAAEADGTAWTGAVPPGRDVAEDPTMFVRAKAQPPAGPPPALPTDPLAMPSLPASSPASSSAIFGAGFGAPPAPGSGAAANPLSPTGTMRSASQAAAAAAVSAVLSSHRQAPAAPAASPAPADDPDATAFRPASPPRPPATAPSPAPAAPAGASPAGGASAAKPLLVGGGIVALLLLAAGAFWWLRSPDTPVAGAPDPASPASAVVASPLPAPAPPPLPVPVEPTAPAPAPVAAASEPSPLPPAPVPSPAAVAATPAPAPAASAPAAESPTAADWRNRVSRLQAARNPLGLAAALGLLLDLPTADDKRVAADLDTLMKSRPQHSALAMAVSDGQLRFHWQAGRPSADRAASDALRRCRELFGANAGCAAVVVNGDFKRDAFTSVAGLLGTQNAATVRQRFVRTLDKALAEQRAKDGPSPAEAVANTPAAPANPKTATASSPAQAKPVNEWADAVAQLRAAEGGLTLARGFELLLQVKDAGEVERLQQLQSAVKRLRWKSAMAVGERGGLIAYGFSREERVVQWAEERAIAECAASGARNCTVVAVDGNLRPGAFIDFAGRLGGRGQAQVRETFLREVQRSLQSGI